MILLWLFVAGASVGSFLNVCIWRLPRGESIVTPPSHCPKCSRQLQALDLVPLLSQLFLRSRCRYCNAKIAWRYFGIELLTAILWVLVGLWAGPFGIDDVTGGWTGDWLRLVQGLIFVSCLVIVFWVDYDTRLIQLEAVFLLGIAGVAVDLWRTTHGQQILSSGGFWPGHTVLPSPLPGSLWAMVVIAALLWLVREGFSWFYGKEALGFGDVILAGAIATHLGWNGTLWTFSFCSVVVGALVGVGLQIPRSIRAYRWAKQRGLKYFERDTVGSLTPVAIPTDPVPANVMSLETGGMGFDSNPISSSAETIDDCGPDLEPNDRNTEVGTTINTIDELDSDLQASIRLKGTCPSKMGNRERGAYWSRLASPLAFHAFRKAIPFGPMLAIGATLALLYGEPLNRAYMNWLGNPATVGTVPTPYPSVDNGPPSPP